MFDVKIFLKAKGEDFNIKKTDLSRTAVTEQSYLGGGSAHLPEISGRPDLCRDGELSSGPGQRDGRHIGSGF